jgi:hypothetical protein
MTDDLDEITRWIDALSRAAFTPRPPPPSPAMKCPYCEKGTMTGPNGESWRCSVCNGIGTIPETPYDPPRTAIPPEPGAPAVSETTPLDPKPEQPEPEADPTAPEPGELDQPNEDEDQDDDDEQAD